MLTPHLLQNELIALRSMSTAQLRARWRSVFGDEPRSYHRQWLMKRLSWALQVQTYGGLSAMARRRIEELTPAAEFSMPLGRAAQAEPPATDVPSPSRTFTRLYRGRTLTVTARGDGFEFEGKMYRSLTGIAQAVTGSHVSGPRFFGVARKASP